MHEKNEAAAMVRELRALKQARVEDAKYELQALLAYKAQLEARIDLVSSKLNSAAEDVAAFGQAHG